MFSFNITKQHLIFLLQLAAFSVFVGRAWQHIVWDAPFRTLLWDEGWMKPIVEGWFHTPWQSYITSEKTDANIQMTIKSMGWFYLLCALMVLTIQLWRRLATIFMYLGSVSLIILAALYCKERFFSIGQFLEYALQFSSPLFLVFILKKETSARLLFFMKVAIAFTFICHGLYAVGYYPRPGYFIEMTMNILDIEETLAIKFLNFAGLMDFVIGVGIFLPFKWSKWFLCYTIFWGFSTTIARVWSYLEFEFFAETARQWVHESVYRIPHFIIPIVLLLSQIMIDKKSKVQESLPL